MKYVEQPCHCLHAFTLYRYKGQGNETICFNSTSYIALKLRAGSGLCRDAVCALLHNMKA